MLREYTSQDIYVTKDSDTIYSLLKNRADSTPSSIIAEYKTGSLKSWTQVTAIQMLREVRTAAKGLLALEVAKGDTVLIYSPTSYAWGVIDFACAAIGAVSVPVYDTDSAGQVENITQETKPELAFVGGSDRAQILEALKVRNDTSVNHVFDLSAGGLKALEEYGKGISEATLEQAIDAVAAGDVATIVYTSGSTGRPKGAMLTNRNFTHTVLNGYEVLPEMIGADPTRLLLFLPLAHCFARYIQYVAIGGHGVVGYIPDAAHLLADLRSFKPTYLLGVPRVFEKVYNAASQKAGNGIKGRIFARAARHFVRWSQDEQDNTEHSYKEILAHSMYQSLVGSTVRSALGPNLRYLACGGAPLNNDLAHFFNGMDGITFIQGYGMTETAAPCVVNFQDRNRVGSVGIVAPGFSVRLTDDDELEIAGPSVFKGYLNNPELTDDAFDGADHVWLRTGDLAEIDDDEFIYITGRKKDLIITAGGKNVSPAPLEDIVSTCPIVMHTVVIGDGKPFISALVTLDPDMLKSWLSSHGFDENTPIEELVENEAVRAFVQEYIDRANTTVSRAESIRKFTILPAQFSQDDKTMTPSLKVIRPTVLKKYAGVIEHVLYAPKPSTKPKAVSAQIIDAADKVSVQVKPQIDAAREKIEPALEKYSHNVSESVNKTYNKVIGKKEDEEERDTRDAA